MEMNKVELNKEALAVYRELDRLFGVKNISIAEAEAILVKQAYHFDTDVKMDDMLEAMYGLLEVPFDLKYVFYLEPKICSKLAVYVENLRDAFTQYDDSSDCEFKAIKDKALAGLVVSRIRSNMINGNRPSHDNLNLFILDMCESDISIVMNTGINYFVTMYDIPLPEDMDLSGGDSKSINDYMEWLDITWCRLNSQYSQEDSPIMYEVDAMVALLRRLISGMKITESIYITSHPLIMNSMIDVNPFSEEGIADPEIGKWASMTDRRNEGSKFGPTDGAIMTTSLKTMRKITALVTGIDDRSKEDLTDPEEKYQTIVNWWLPCYKLVVAAFITTVHHNGDSHWKKMLGTVEQTQVKEGMELYAAELIEIAKTMKNMEDRIEQNNSPKE